VNTATRNSEHRPLFCALGSPKPNGLPPEPGGKLPTEEQKSTNIPGSELQKVSFSSAKFFSGQK
jgi:hypothetical protein